MSTGKHPAPSCFLDTSALIPLLEPAHPNASKITAYLSSSSFSLWTDPIVLSEYLAGVAVDRRHSLVHALSEMMQITPLTQQGALIAADIFTLCKEHGVVPRHESGKQVVKADILILASAVEASVDLVLYADGTFGAIRNVLPNAIRQTKLPEFINIARL